MGKSALENYKECFKSLLERKTKPVVPPPAGVAVHESSVEPPEEAVRRVNVMKSILKRDGGDPEWVAELDALLTRGRPITPAPTLAEPEESQAFRDRVDEWRDKCETWRANVLLAVKETERKFKPEVMQAEQWLQRLQPDLPDAEKSHTTMELAGATREVIGAAFNEAREQVNKLWSSIASHQELSGELTEQYCDQTKHLQGLLQSEGAAAKSLKEAADSWFTFRSTTQGHGETLNMEVEELKKAEAAASNLLEKVYKLTDETDADQTVLKALVAQVDEFLVVMAGEELYSLRKDVESIEQNVRELLASNRQLASSAESLGDEICANLLDPIHTALVDASSLTSTVFGKDLELEVQDVGKLKVQSFEIDRMLGKDHAKGEEGRENLTSYLNVMAPAIIESIQEAENTGTEITETSQKLLKELVMTVAQNKSDRRSANMSQAAKVGGAVASSVGAIVRLIISGGGDITGYISLGMAVSDIVSTIKEATQDLEKREVELAKALDNMKTQATSHLNKARASAEAAVASEGQSVGGLGTAIATLISSLSGGVSEAQKWRKLHGSKTAVLLMEFHDARLEVEKSMTELAGFSEVIEAAQAEDTPREKVDPTQLSEAKNIVAARTKELGDGYQELIHVGQGIKRHLKVQLDAAHSIAEADEFCKKMADLGEKVSKASKVAAGVEKADKEVFDSTLRDQCLELGKSKSVGEYLGNTGVVLQQVGGSALAAPAGALDALTTVATALV